MKLLVKGNIIESNILKKKEDSGIVMLKKDDEKLLVVKDNKLYNVVNVNQDLISENNFITIGTLILFYDKFGYKPFINNKPIKINKSKNRLKSILSTFISIFK